MPIVSGIAPLGLNRRGSVSKLKNLLFSELRLNDAALQTTLIPIWRCPSCFQGSIGKKVKKNYICRLFLLKIICNLFLLSLRSPAVSSAEDKKRGGSAKEPPSSFVSRRRLISPEPRSPSRDAARGRQSSSRAGRRQPPCPDWHLRAPAPWRRPGRRSTEDII